MKFICKGKDLGHLPARQDPDDEIGHPIVHLGQQRGIRRVTDPVGLGRKKFAGPTTFSILLNRSFESAMLPPWMGL